MLNFVLCVFYANNKIVIKQAAIIPPASNHRQCLYFCLPCLRRINSFFGFLWFSRESLRQVFGSPRVSKGRCWNFLWVVNEKGGQLRSWPGSPPVPYHRNSRPTEGDGSVSVGDGMLSDVSLQGSQRTWGRARKRGEMLWAEQLLPSNGPCLLGQGHLRGDQWDAPSNNREPSSIKGGSYHKDLINGRRHGKILGLSALYMVNNNY